MKKKKKKYNYNIGGTVNPTQGAVDTISNIAGSFGPIGQAAGAAVQIANSLLTDPSNYKPVRQNTVSGYNKGGDIPLSNQSAEVGGNLGVDANSRMVKGQPVNLTKGETVQSTDLGAFVFSDKKDMLDPISGLTFAKAAKKLQKTVGKAEKALERTGSDAIAKATIKKSNEMLESLAQRQQELNGNNQGEAQGMAQPEGNYAVGGVIPLGAYNNLGRELQTNSSAYGLSDAYANSSPATYYQQNPTAPRTTFSNNQVLKNAGASVPNFAQGQSSLGTPMKRNTSVTPPIQSGGQRTLTQQRNAALPSVVMPTQGSIKSSRNPYTDRENFGKTPGDKLNLVTDLATVFAKGVQASQPLEQYNNDKYNIDRQIFSPQKALDQNRRNMNSATFGINSGNASTDSARKLTAYAANQNADRDTIREYDAMQRQSDQQIQSINQQSRARVDDINDQNEGTRRSEIDNVITSVGQLGTTFQNTFNAQTKNNVTLSTLNSLSQRYGIDVETLNSLRQQDPAAFEKLLQYKG